MDQPPPYSATEPAATHKGQQNFRAQQPNYGPQQPNYAQPPPSYSQPSCPPPPPGFVPTYGSTTQHIIINTPIIGVGACPACRVGILEDDFTLLGLLCAIVFFPVGILCCLALKNRRCSNCGAYFA